jgi:hypothetical protein
MSRLCHNKTASSLQVERGEPLRDARSGDLASFVSIQLATCGG